MGTRFFPRGLKAEVATRLGIWERGHITPRETARFLIENFAMALVFEKFDEPIVCEGVKLVPAGILRIMAEELAGDHCAEGRHWPPLGPARSNPPSPREDEWGFADPEQTAAMEVLERLVESDSIVARWRTSDVIGLALGIKEDAAFDRLPILSDALMDAGCEDEVLVGHCRKKRHTRRNCWVVELILGTASLPNE